MGIRNRIAVFAAALAAIPSVAQMPVGGTARIDAQVVAGRSDARDDARPCRDGRGRRDAPRWSTMAA